MSETAKTTEPSELTAAPAVGIVVKKPGFNLLSWHAKHRRLSEKYAKFALAICGGIGIVTGAAWTAYKYKDESHHTAEVESTKKSCDVLRTVNEELSVVMARVNRVSGKKGASINKVDIALAETITAQAKQVENPQLQLELSTFDRKLLQFKNYTDGAYTLVKQTNANDLSLQIDLLNRTIQDEHTKKCT